MSEESKDLYVLGKVTGYYGVKGWVKLYSYTEPKENIVRYHSLQIKRSPREEWQPIQLDSGKAHGKGVVAHFSGYDNREISASLIGSELGVNRSDFKPAGKDEYYWTDLIKLQVVNLQGVELGQVNHLIETAAHDVLVIDSIADIDGSKTVNEILIPFVQGHYIKNVDLQEKVITVDWLTDWNSSD